MLYQKGGAVFAEIQDQPRLWKLVLQNLEGRREQLQGWLKGENFGQIMFLASGPCYGAALSAASVMQLVSGLNTVVMPSSEILFLRRPPYDSRIKTLVLVFGRDGDEQDTFWALEKLRRLHTSCKALYVGGEPGQLAALTDHQVLIAESMEAGPIATRLPSAVLLVAMVLTAWLSGKDVFLNELSRVPDVVDFKSLQDQLQLVSSAKPQPLHFTFLGSGPYHGAAWEGALKVREMAAIGAEAHYPLEFRHGGHAWLTNQTSVVSLISDTFRNAELRTAFQLAALRAPRVLIGETLEEQAQMRVDAAVQLRAGVSEISRVLVMFPVVQLLAFYLAISKGKNPDKPKHVETPVEIKERPGV